MPDDHSKALMERLRRHNEEIAQAAARQMIAAWQPAEAGGRAGVLRQVRDAPDRTLELVVAGFRRLGPVVGLSVFAGEPALIVDDIAWLRRAFAVRGVVPTVPGWEARLLEAFAGACCHYLPEEDCSAIRETIRRAASALTPA
jgi:hypothetical protein